MWAEQHADQLYEEKCTGVFIKFKFRQ
jgi:hypothetical protein